jgi:hypothetical protein
MILQLKLQLLKYHSLFYLLFEVSVRADKNTLTSTLKSIMYLLTLCVLSTKQYYIQSKNHEYL